jgi:hypothetical protein
LPYALTDSPRIDANATDHHVIYMTSPRYKTPRDPRQSQLLNGHGYQNGIHPDAPAGGGGPGHFTSRKPCGTNSVIAFHSHTGPRDAKESDWVLRMNRSFTEAEMAAGGDILDDLWDTWNRAKNVKKAQELALEKYVGPMILEETGEGLEEILKGLIPGLLVTLLVVVGTTALGTGIGFAIGFLFGGVGAGPGALLGAKAGLALGLWVLKWMGLAFLVIYIAENFGEVLELIKSGITHAWNASDGGTPEKEREGVHRGARDMARAVAVVVRLVLEGIVLFLLAKGTAAVASRLAELVGSLRNSKFGKGFADWVEKNHRKLFENPKLNRKRGSTAQENRPSPSASPGAVAPSGGKPQTGSEAGKPKTGSATGKPKAGLGGRGQRPQPGERSTTRAEWEKSERDKRLKRGSRGVRNVRLDKTWVSQGHVDSKLRDGTPIEVMAENMRKNGWDYTKEPPNMVEYPDGRIVTVDHRRLVAAKQAGLEEVPARVHPASERINAEIAERFSLKTEFTDPETGRVYKLNDVPSNWGEAAKFRSANQRVMGHPDFPIEGSPNFPEIRERKKRR